MLKQTTEAPLQTLGLASAWVTLWVRSLRRPSELGWVPSLLRQRSSGVWISRTWSSGQSTDVCQELGSQICWTTAETIRRKTSLQVGPSVVYRRTLQHDDMERATFMIALGRNPKPTKSERNAVSRTLSCPKLQNLARCKKAREKCWAGLASILD